MTHGYSTDEKPIGEPRSSDGFDCKRMAEEVSQPTSPPSTSGGMRQSGRRHRTYNNGGGGGGGGGH